MGSSPIQVEFCPAQGELRLNLKTSEPQDFNERSALA